MNLKMKRRFLAVSLAALLSSPVLAQPAQQPAEQAKPGASAGQGKASQAASEQVQVAAARKIIGDPVRDQSGKDLGEVEYLMIGVDNGQVRYAIIDPGAGADDQLVPVPWQALKVSGGGEDRSLSVDRQRFDKQQRFSREQIVDLTQPAVVTSVLEYWAPITQNQGQQGKAQDGSQAQGGAQGAGSQQGKAAPGGQQRSGSDRQAGDQGAQPHLLVGREVVTTVLAPAFRTTDNLRGSEVYSSDNESFGEIDNVIVDLDQARVAYVQIAHGGFLGLGGEITPVPYEALSYDREENTYRLPKSQADLRSIQSFARGDEPTSIRRTDLAKLYKDFGIQPYWQEKS